MKELKIIVKAKDTIGICVSFIDTVYSDNIVKNQNYSNVVQKYLKAVNGCATDFSLPAMTLFEQQDAFGSTFKATIGNTVIPAGQTVNIPVTYNGIYKSGNLNPSFNFTINNIALTYNLIISVPDAVGSITDFTIEKANRVNHTFQISDFTTHHSDTDGDTIQTVTFFDNVYYLRLNDIAYVADTEVPLSDIGLGKLTFSAPAQDAESIINISYKVKDSKNNIII